MKIEHILLTTDLSPEALRPFGPVIELARSLGSRVTVLHVVQDLPVTPHAAPFAPPMSSPDLGRQIEEARAALEKQRDAMPDSLPLSLEVIGHENPAEGIVDYAKEHGVDLIALSTHGRTGFRRLTLGSVAETVLRHSPVPVLSFHRPHEG